MKPEIVIELLHAQPFRPLAFRFNDGSHVKVSRPELVVIERDTIWFFKPSEDDRIADGFRVGSLQNLKTVERAEATP